jgi:hypothetical protein
MYCRFLVAPPGLEPGLSALKGPRVNQLHHGAKHTIPSHHFNYIPSTTLNLKIRAGRQQILQALRNPDGLFTQRAATSILDGLRLLRKAPTPTATTAPSFPPDEARYSSSALSFPHSWSSFVASSVPSDKPYATSDESASYSARDSFSSQQPTQHKSPNQKQWTEHQF